MGLWKDKSSENLILAVIRGVFKMAQKLRFSSLYSLQNNAVVTVFWF